MKYILVYSTLSCIIYPFYTIKTRKECAPFLVKAYHGLFSWMPSDLYNFLLVQHDKCLLKHLPCKNSTLEAFGLIMQHEGVFGLYKGFSLFSFYTVSRFVLTHICLKYQSNFYKQLLQKSIKYFSIKLPFLQKKEDENQFLNIFCKILIHTQVTSLLFPLLVITYRLRLNEEPVSLGLSRHIFATLVHQSLFYFNELPHSYALYMSTLMSYFFFSPSTRTLLLERCTSSILGFGLTKSK